MAVRWVVPARRQRTRLEPRVWLRTSLRRGPEDWVWPVVAVAWLVLGWVALRGHPAAAPAAGQHAHHAGMPAGAPPGSGVLAQTGEHLLLWVVMVAATMLPLVAWNLRAVALRSPGWRRRRATLEVAAGWSLVWLAAGVVVVPLVVLSGAGHPAAWAVVGACALAVAWQLSPARRLASARCHRRFAPPLGAAAGPACLRFGRSLGRDCLLTCGPAMVLMSVAGHQPVVVLALGWLAWRDRRRPADRPGVAVPVGLLLGVGAFTLLAQP